MNLQFKVIAQIGYGGKMNDYTTVVTALSIEDALENVKRKLHYQGCIFRIISIVEEATNGKTKNLSAKAQQ